VAAKPLKTPGCECGNSHGIYNIMGIYSPHEKQGTRKSGKNAQSGIPGPALGSGSSHFWMKLFRTLLVRYKKLTCSYKGLLMLACAFIAFRRAGFIPSWV
jgi:hypothetical protein